MSFMILLVLIFIMLGILIKHKKYYWLISGYNTLSKEKKKNVDVEGLGIFMGNTLFAMAGAFLIGAVFDYFGIFTGSAISFGSIFFIIIYMIIGAQKYDNNSRRSDGKLQSSVIFIIGFIVLIFISVASLIIYWSVESKVNVSEDYFEITGIYGMKLDIDDIKDISLADNIPKINRKTNGFDFGKILKGNFELDEIGNVKLYINRGTAPYINIKYRNSHVILNFKDSSKTQDLYYELKKQWN